MNKRETHQIGTALITASGYTINGEKFIPLATVLQVLASHADGDFIWTSEGDGLWKFNTDPEEQDAPKPE